MAGDLVFLTGATGFVGFRTLVLLLKAGYNVRAAVRNTAGFEKIKASKLIAPHTSQLDPVVDADITTPGTYDEAVMNVKYIVHIASPFASAELLSADHETACIQPAVNGTVGMLDSTNKVAGFERVILTGSIPSIASFSSGW